jgi:hypothetical protein
VLAALLVLNMLRKAEEQMPVEEDAEADAAGAGPIIDASRWTGG